MSYIFLVGMNKVLFKAVVSSTALLCHHYILEAEQEHLMLLFFLFFSLPFFPTKSLKVEYTAVLSFSRKTVAPITGWN